MSVAFVREESAESAQEVTLPARPISAHPNLVTQSGLHALEQAVAKGRAAVKAAQLIEDMNERRRAIELARATCNISPNVSRARNYGRRRRASKSSRLAIALPLFATTPVVRPTELSARMRLTRA